MRNNIGETFSASKPRKIATGREIEEVAFSWLYVTCDMSPFETRIEALESSHCQLSFV